MNVCVPAGVVVFMTSLLAFAGAASEQSSNVHNKPGSERVPSTARTLHLPEVPYRYASIDLPVHFNEPAAKRFDNTPPNNPLTNAGVTLGRVLFYDTRLSANNTVSCGSCPRAVARVCRSQPIQPRIQGRVDRSARDDPGQPALPPERPLLLGRAGGSSRDDGVDADREPARDGAGPVEAARDPRRRPALPCVV
jgi:hypothetical protein